MSRSFEKPQSFLRHPLLHFTVLGVLIFAWDAIRDTPPSPNSLNISISPTQVTRMSGLWEKTWGRPPTSEELDGLIQDHIKEEIYYREAKTLGLDQNDIVIRRRLRQKMEFLSSDVIESQTPDETLLLEYYKENQDKYRSSTTRDLKQIYYKATRKGQAAADISQLNSGASPENFGDMISLPNHLSNADEAKITKLFGSVFYSELEALAPNVWHGPIRSGFGLHLVRVSSLTPSAPLPFEQVKDKVEADWRAQAIIEKQEKTYEALRQDYNISIKMPNE